DAYARISKEVQGKALDFTKFIERIKPSLPATTALEDVESALQGLVISNTLINGGVQVNSVPEEADADFNIRTIPEYDNEQVKTLFPNTFQDDDDYGANLSSDLYLDLHLVLTTGDNSLINTAQNIAQSLFDKDFIASPNGGVTDAS